jgi:replicative DNA helicase
MAVVDDREVGPAVGPAPGFERQPPQDIQAEQSVLGGMMLSKDAIADVVEVLRSGDFYRPAHQTIYDTILDLYGRGEPADPITVSAELTRTGSLLRVGGAAYLATLINGVPTAANAGYYAEIVAERAVLRRLVEAGTRIVQLGYGAASGQGGDVDEVVDRAQAEIYEVTERRMSEDYVRLEQLLQGTMDEIDAISTHGGSVGVPTGFAELDQITNGLHAGQMIVIAARPAIGKALALDTPLPTPTGWTTMGAVAVGDALIDAAGRPTRVVAATEVMHGRPCYEVTFSDGSVIVADGQHQWRTTPAAAPRPARVLATVGGGGTAVADRPADTFSTEQIATSLRAPAGAARWWNHAVAVARPLHLPPRALPVDPYALGAWLGGAHTGPVVPAAVRSAASRPTAAAAVAKARTFLAGGGRRETGPGGPDVLAADQRIPAAYLRAGEQQRRALLAGLVDSTGVSNAAGGAVWCAGAGLARDAYELVVGLGYQARVRSAAARGRFGERHLVVFTAADPVRYVTGVRRIGPVPVRCVQVDNDEHLYLAGRSMIPTHNSTLGLDLARSCSIKNGLTSVIFSLEMGRSEITMRLLSAEAKVALNHMRSGHMSDEDWARLARRMGEVADAPLYIDDSPNLTMMEIRAKARRLRQRNDLRLVVVDYLQLMTSGKRVESRQQEVSEFSRSLKLLAKELEVPVVAISQLNRGPEQRQDKRPMLSDLRESGAIEQDADMVLLLHREDAYERESPRAGEADLILAKHRNGPTSTVTVAFQGHYSRFVDMAT